MAGEETQEADAKGYEPCVCVLSRFNHVWLFATLRCNPPVCSVPGILQARILEWVAMPSFQGIFPIQGPNSFPALQAASLPSEPPGKFMEP